MVDKDGAAIGGSSGIHSINNNECSNNIDSFKHNFAYEKVL